MEERAESVIRVTEEVMKYTRIDVFWYWEDMAYNHASLVDPKMYRRFALKHYRRVNDWLKSKGIRHIGLDSDGNITELIPVWIDAGLTHLWPFEVQSGMDVLAVRKKYGKSLGHHRRHRQAGAHARVPRDPSPRSTGSCRSSSRAATSPSSTTACPRTCPGRTSSSTCATWTSGWAGRGEDERWVQ